jgi:hypothetical protein
MDTRPWRLQLPPGTSWFDVDQRPVISLKASLLREGGADLGDGAAPGGSGPSTCGGGVAGGAGGGCGVSGKRSGGGETCSNSVEDTQAFPLRVAAYKQVGWAASRRTRRLNCIAAEHAVLPSFLSDWPRCFTGPVLPPFFK